MTQLSNTTSTYEAQWKMWLLQVFALIYLTAVCAAQDETATSTLPDKTSPMPTTVYDPPEPSLQLISHLSDVFTSEKVILNCSISSSSDWTFTWQKDGQLLHQNADFSFSNDGSVLTITANTKEIAGSYTCRGEDRGKGRNSKNSQPVEVRVNELPTLTLKRQTPWADVFEGEAVTFRCEPLISEWNIIWYKDQQPLNKEGSSLEINPVSKNDKGAYTCKAQLKSRHVSSGFSNTENLNVNSNNPKPTLTQSPDFDQLYPQESINFICTVDVSSEWKYEWYKDGNKIQQASSEKYEIASVSPSNNGKYHCKVKRGEGPLYQSNHKSIQVAELPIPTLKLVTPWSDVFKTEVLNFSCRVPSTEWTLTWYKDQKDLNQEGPYHEITSVTKDHEGVYTCKAQLKSRGVTSASSNPEAITVYENKPIPVLTRSPTFPTMYPGESITFTCTVSVSSGWGYEWYHNGIIILSFSSKTSTIVPVTYANSGEYQCMAKRGQLRTDKSGTVSLQVSDPPTPILKLLSPWAEVFKNETLKFSCEVSGSEWTFTWHKDQTELQNTSSMIQNEKGSVLNIKAVTQSNQGQYTCKAHLKHRGVNSVFSNTSTVKVHESIPTPTLSRNQNFSPMYIGETVKLKCTETVSSGWSYHWYKNGIDLNKAGNEISITLSLTDHGGYSCKARRGETTSTGHSDEIQLDVREIPVPILNKKTDWLDVFPSEEVELSCKMEKSSGWKFTWYKNAKELPKDNATNSEVEGTLSISHASPSDRESYHCFGRLNGRSVISRNSSEVILHVYDKKPTVTLLQNPSDSLMHTSDVISFTCHVNVSSGWNYQWYKDNHKLESSGIIHNISSAKTSDSGSYQCQVRRMGKRWFDSEKSQAVKLAIAERPKASIILLTGWSEVFSTDSLRLKCEVVGSSDTWNYTWFIEDKELIQTTQPSHIYVVTPQNDPEQSLYTCEGYRNERPLYSKRSDSYRTKNLLLKRRILLSISGCLFFGIIAVFLGCIALRVFRKPVTADDKQEESNLFLTMAQLKDRNDALCPLVEYITDADLNPPAKEGEENGTSCSETTPLPITSPEEQAVTTNGKETTENGGGMVSFLH